LLYHVECQSGGDETMVVRMVEYDFAIALGEAVRAGAPYEMDFPESCVLYLRKAGETPDFLEMRVNLPGGEHFTYRARAVYAQRYGRSEIAAKGLALLLPFYLMRYEGALSKIAGDDARAEAFVAECAGLRGTLEALTLAEGDRMAYEVLTELIMRVADHVLRAEERLRQEARKAMGGEVLELSFERGVREGLKEGREEMIGKLRMLGVDEGLLQRAATEVAAKQAAAEAAARHAAASNKG
jgi:hypothetical protein